MRSFFKTFFASLLALFIFSVLVFIVVLVFISIAASPDKPDIGSKAVLVLDLGKQYQEQEQDDPLAALTGNADVNVPGLYDVIRLIGHAKKDNDISGIYIKSLDNANGFAASEELRNALADFKTSKKFVVAYGDVISQKAYYVASIADKVYCNPKGMVDWRGMASTLFFMKGTLEKLDIQPQIFYAGKFKSATEPLRETKMTEANRVQTSVYINDLYSRVLLAAAQRSGLDTGTLHRIANEGAIQSGSDAVKYKLIDGLKYDDEVKTELINNLKIKEADKINFVSIGKYEKAVDYRKTDGDRIAVVYAEGEIIDGKGKDGQVGSEDFRNIIRKLRLDKKVKAIVFRVNSPGGSSLASEVIWREITLAKKDKPVVVSFGDVAASGGYYISCNADSIFAQPNTITGSIGVFGIIPNMEKFFNNKLGITFDGVKTGPFADMMSINRPLNVAESAFVQNTIDTIYADFKGRVATGRKLSSTIVDSIAQGRVWTGQRALGIGLVDRIGGINDAIACAGRMAKLKNFSLREYPEKKTFLQQLFDVQKTEVATRMVKEDIGDDQYKLLQHLQQVRQMISVPQARLPFELQIK
jgi:protease IV